VTVGQLVTFTATRGATTSPITSARLEFGDGESVSLGSLSSPVTVSHAYTSPGTYTARLVVTDNGGETASEVQVVQVRGVAGATVTATAETNRRVTATATLNGTSAGDAVSYEWTFEGTTPNMVTTTNQATFTYDSGGSKTITVRIILRDGRTATASTSITLPS
jgi:PKD repeat protein